LSETWSREGREEGEGKSLNQKPSSLHEEEIGKAVLDSAFKVHTAFGPDLKNPSPPSRSSRDT